MRLGRLRSETRFLLTRGDAAVTTSGVAVGRSTAGAFVNGGGGGERDRSSSVGTKIISTNPSAYIIINIITLLLPLLV
jgi:hypothetical protein